MWSLKTEERSKEELDALLRAGESLANLTSFLLLSRVLEQRTARGGVHGAVALSWIVVVLEERSWWVGPEPSPGEQHIFVEVDRPNFYKKQS